MNTASRDERFRSRRSAHPHVPSPLDPFMRDFLQWIAAKTDGLTPPGDVQRVSDELDWQPSFTEVLFTAARSRGLLSPNHARGGKNRLAWQLSSRGTHWLSEHEAFVARQDEES